MEKKGSFEKEMNGATFMVRRLLYWDMGYTHCRNTCHSLFNKKKKAGYPPVKGKARSFSFILYQKKKSTPNGS